MSNYCGGCAYDVKDRLGDRACPFNALYWDFLDRNSERLGKNLRLAMPYKTLGRMSVEDRAAIQAKASKTRRELGATVRG